MSLGSVVEGGFVSCEPLLEGVGCKPNVFFCLACSFHCALVHTVGGLALAIQGTGGLSAVVAHCLHAGAGAGYFFIVSCDDLGHVKHAAVADLHCVPVDHSGD